jgi:hypothetical protein
MPTDEQIWRRAEYLAERTVAWSKFDDHHLLVTTVVYLEEMSMILDLMEKHLSHISSVGHQFQTGMMPEHTSLSSIANDLRIVRDKIDHCDKRL